jgi:hypothetical protein
MCLTAGHDAECQLLAQPQRIVTRFLQNCPAIRAGMRSRAYCSPKLVRRFRLFIIGKRASIYKGRASPAKVAYHINILSPSGDRSVARDQCGLGQCCFSLTWTRMASQYHSF